MIFQHTWQAVLDGTKTQARRLAKPNEFALQQELPFGGYKVIDVHTGRLSVLKSRKVYEVGKTYAVQPGRGQKAIARIRITAISRQDVREITESQALAEGGYDPQSYLCLWASIHDKTLNARQWQTGKRKYLFDLSRILTLVIEDDSLANILPVYNSRPAEHYQAWVLTFERCD